MFDKHTKVRANRVIELACAAEILAHVNNPVRCARMMIDDLRDAEIMSATREHGERHAKK